jgi:tetratricopeptide (TPR) repeat protein
MAQDIVLKDYRGELNIKLEVLDDKRLEKGIEIINSAIPVEQSALELLRGMSDKEKIEGSSSDYKKMIKYFTQASELYKEGHGLIYMVYNDNCAKFLIDMKKMNHYASGMNKAKYYENKGERTKARADNIRQLLLDADKPEWIQYKMHEAFQLEKLAIRDKGRALQIYQDFPVEYNYGWDDDVTPEELAKFFNNPLVKLPPEVVFKVKPSEVKKEPEGGPIQFRVQIAAHTVPLEQGYIRTFYTGNDTVNETYENGWYKYQIGTFETFQDAEKLRVGCRVPRAFIVAYQDNKKISIKEALAKIQAIQ